MLLPRLRGESFRNVSERLRLFVALELPLAVRAALAAWATDAAPAGVRLVPAENLHVTLAFLGSRAAEDAEAVAALLAGVAVPLGRVATAGALWLPRRKPGVLSVALTYGDAVGALRDRLVAGLVDAIGYEPEERAFRPHVTVGRVARDARSRLDTRGELEPPVPALSFEPPALTLYRSRTAPDGARYEALARAALAG
jgi:2'-5' RNA ligase